MIVGYHSSHEQFLPSDLLTLVRKAEDCGFQAIMTSDHFNPWSISQANAGNNWVWLGAAMASTSIPFGSIAVPGGWRYQPVVLAQMISTLTEMYPDRLRWVALGSGEALNEHVVGQGWPDKETRNQRLVAGYKVISALLRGETVSASYDGFAAEEAKLWSLANQPPALFCTALSAQTSTFAGSWSEGLVTVWESKAKLLELGRTFRVSGGEGRPLVLQLQVSWAKSKDEARQAAWSRWRNAAAGSDQLAELKTPAQFDVATANVTLEEMDAAIPLVTKGDDVLAIMADCASCGFEEVYIHNVADNQLEFFKFMKSEVLPHIT